MKTRQQHFTFLGTAWIATLCFTLLSFTSPALQEENTRTFSLNGFDKLDLGSAFIIHVRQGSQFSIKATGQKRDLDELDANVSGGTLKVRYNQNWNRNRKRVTFEITMPTLRGIDFSGASTSDVRGFRNQGNMNIDISGASTATIELDAARINVDFSGASTVSLMGKAERMEGTISGATTLKAFDLATKQARLEVSGASGVRVNVSEKLDIDASGASSVRYRGGASVSSNTSGASSVRRDS